MPLLFCTSERLPSKLALKVYASKNGCNFKKKHSWNGSYCPLRIVTSLSLHFNATFILLPSMGTQLFPPICDPAFYRERFYLEFLQLFSFICLCFHLFFPLLFSSISTLISFNNISLFLKHFLLIYILNIQYSLLRFLCLLWFYSLQDQYSQDMSWLLSIQTCCHQLQYLD